MLLRRYDCTSPYAMSSTDHRRDLLLAALGGAAIAGIAFAFVRWRTASSASAAAASTSTSSKAAPAPPDVCDHLHNLRETDVFVLDNSLRETTVASMYGHTIEGKYRILEAVRSAGTRTLHERRSKRGSRCWTCLACVSLLSSPCELSPNHPLPPLALLQFSPCATGMKHLIVGAFGPTRRVDENFIADLRVRMRS